MSIWPHETQPSARILRCQPVSRGVQPYPHVFVHMRAWFNQNVRLTMVSGASCRSQVVFVRCFSDLPSLPTCSLEKTCFCWLELNVR